MPLPITADHIRRYLRYCPKREAFLRKSTGAPATRDVNGVPYVRISTGGATSTERTALEIVWILKHGVEPVGGRITPIDGNWYNFKLSNLQLSTYKLRKLNEHTS
jgi:hypothetical protein